MNTPEQQAAEKLMDEAIAALHQAYPDKDDFNGILTASLTVTVRKGFSDQDSDGRTRVDYFTGLNSVPHYELLGMLDFVQQMLRHEVTCHGVGDDS